VLPVVGKETELEDKAHVTILFVPLPEVQFREILVVPFPTVITFEAAVVGACEKPALKVKTKTTGKKICKKLFIELNNLRG
jgi:hypothetical protein